MEQRSRVIVLILSVFLVGYLSFAKAQDPASLGQTDESGNISASVSADSSSLDITDRNPCSFRGKFLSHRESVTLDPCTVCLCKNGTTTCEIESCPSEAGCEPGEIVNIPQACCPQCPYKMYVENTNNLYADTFEFTKGSTKKIRFGLDIEVDRKLTSRLVRGENLWKLTAWVSPNEDGSGPRFSEQDNLFNEKDAMKEYLKPNYSPWDWAKLRYTMKFSGGSCADYNFFCVQFGQADVPRPSYDLSFTFQAVDNEEERLIDCVPLGECKKNRLKAVDLDWEIEAEDPIYGQSTPVSLNVDAIFDAESANKRGDGLWRVGLFGSPNGDGSGPRFDEIYQTLAEAEASTAKRGTRLGIDDIETNFEIGSIGCNDDASYVCVEFAQGDNPDPPFTMTIEYVRQGGAELDSMVLCKPQECSARAIFSTLVPDLTGIFPAIENRPNTIQMNLDAITDKDLSTLVPGDYLWELGTFFNARPNGKGPRILEQTQILNPMQQDGDLSFDENLDFNGIEFPTDLTGLVCCDVPFICFELKKNKDASLNYIFGTNPTQDPFVECIDFTKYCKADICHQRDLPISGAVFVRWGRPDCPEASDLLYSGIAGGSRYRDLPGGGANILCLPPDPSFVNSVNGVGNARAFLYSVEYQISDFPTWENYHFQDVSCAVCKATGRYSHLMIPAKQSCPSSEWTREYRGYLMTERSHSVHHRSMFICMDQDPQPVPGSGGRASAKSARLDLVEGRCSTTGGGLSCDTYPDGKEFQCAVCTL